MLARPSGDLYLANSVAGFSQPTSQLGDFSTASTYLSRVAASGTPVFADRIGGVYTIRAIGLDPSGNALVAGNAAADGLPVTPGAWISTSSGSQTAFVCKINAADGTLGFCTYLNSNQIDIISIGADAAGNVYLLSKRGSATISATPGALSLGDRQIVLMKLNPAGSTLLWTAEFGGSLGEGPEAMTVDPSGNAFVTGVTNSTDFLGASSGALPTPSGSFVTKVDSSGSKLLYSSYGVAGDSPLATALDTSGALYVTGVSLSNTAAVFIMKVTTDGSKIAYHVTLPPNPDTSVPSIAADVDGSATVVGSTSALALTHILTATCRQANLPYPSAGAAEAFMVRIAPDGSVLQSTYVGAGTTPVQAFAITGGSAGQAWIAVGNPKGASAGILQVGADSTGASLTSIGCMENAATFASGALAPGEIFSIFGEGLGPAVGSVSVPTSAGQFPGTLAGVEVTFDGTSAPLLYVQEGQVNAVTPWELAGKASTQMCASYAGKNSCTTILLGRSAPGIFSSNLVDAAAINQDGTVNSAGNPAHFGSVVSLYVTGLGPVSPVPPDGSLTQFPLPTLVYPVQVTFFNPNVAPFQATGEILYAGPAPLEIGGLFQINVRLPSFPASITIQSELPDGTAVRSPSIGIATAP